ncbi:hypothetical protein F753_08390 [Stutzerimonas chloritidismutans AW-1]|uniref:DUF4214 domain-containing protein n=1 Tax=Stutzerimonas chloritidismutans AW-1 TaxID=1263865 RepID=V4S3J6_STUCH|nr:DUF4214 domain-containing protein [Stutzerimonas chloritidismutans]ESQ99786.1 hypothetical protein F753_08390 [Stutzerimonas chloritidismutans AW-1]
MANAIASQVQALYVGYLGRAADQAGLDFWTNAITAGTSTIESVALGFTLSQEYTSKYEGLTTTQLVEQVYFNLLGRAADAEGSAFWAGEIDNGTISADTLIASMINSLGAIDQQVIDNKVYVANAYTASAGAAYNVEAGAAVLVGVDGTQASVAAALQNIGNGTVPGAVPGLALFNAIETAEKALAAYQLEAAKLAVAAGDVDDVADNVVIADKKVGLTLTEATAAVGFAQADRDALVSSTTKTSVLELTASEAATDLAAAKTAVQAQANGPQAVRTYESAVAAFAALTENSAAQEAAAEAGFTAANGTISVVELNATLTNDLTDGAYDTIYAALTSLSTTAADRAKIVDAVSELQYGSDLVKLADNEYAINKAGDAVTKAETAVKAITDGQAYLVAFDTKAEADELLADVREADAVIKALTAIEAELTKLDDAVTKAETALSDFESDNDVDFVVIDSPLTLTDDSSDVLYVGAATGASDDVVFANFGEGKADYILLGSEYTFNSGATTAGNNNVLEYFVIQDGADAKVVIETAKYGSGSLGYDATSGEINASTDAVVIELTGVNVADLAIANGVISYVA